MKRLKAGLSRKRTISLSPDADAIVREEWSRQLRNGRNATYSSVVNALLLGTTLTITTTVPPGAPSLLAVEGVEIGAIVFGPNNPPRRVQ